MAFAAILGVIGLATSVAGTAVGMMGAQKQAKAQKMQAEYQRQALEEQKKAEQARREQMQLDANRRRREAVRQQQIARSQALATATAQGAGGGSGLQGAYGEISGATGTNISGINSAEAIGNRIFDANMASHEAYKGVAYWGGKAADAGTMQAMGSGISSLGGAVVKNLGGISRVGGFG